MQDLPCLNQALSGLNKDLPSLNQDLLSLNMDLPGLNKEFSRFHFSQEINSNHKKGILLLAETIFIYSSIHAI